MKAKVMKKYIIPGIIILAFFISTFAVFGQPAEQQNKQQTERLEKLRDAWQNMSEEQKQKYRSEVQNRAGAISASVGEQLEVVKLIEQQVAQLKTALESINQGRERYQNIPEGERAQYRKKITGAAQARQQAIAAIEQQLERLKFTGQRQPMPEPQARINELKEIHQLAIKEKAAKTAKRLENLIAKYQPRPKDARDERTPVLQQQPRRQEDR